jgi:hypothetical protein
MKLYMKFLLFVLVAAVAAPFILRDRDGRPLMSLDKLHMPEVALPDASALTTALGSAQNALVTAETTETVTTKIYKWQDELGGWHYSNDPRPDGLGEALEIDTRASVTHFDSPATAVDAPKTVTQTSPATTLLPLGQTVDVMNDARQVDTLLKARQQQQARAIGD